MVQEWESTAEFPLKAIKLPKVGPDALINKGSSIAEVLAIQGTPVSVNDVYWTNTAPGSPKSGALSFGKTTYWYYGASSIEFSGDKVIGWTEKPGSPLRAAH
jgi:hypothetical protein